jgi:uncharacterized membrane protein
MKWILITLLAYFVFSLTKIIDGVCIKKYLNPKTYLCYHMFLQGLIGILILFFIDTIFYGTYFLLIAFVTALFYVYALIPYVRALEFEEVSRLIPLFNLRPIFVLVFSIIIFGIKLTVIQYIGFIFLIMGGFFISIKKIEGIFKISRGLFYMLLTSLLFSFSLIGTDWLFKNYDFWSSLAYIQLGVLVSSLSLLFLEGYGKGIQKIRDVSGIAKLLLVSVAVIGFVGIAIRNFAISISSAALVSSLEGFQSLFVLGLTILFSFKAPKILKEETSIKIILIKLIAIIFLIEGVWLINI